MKRWAGIITVVLFALGMAATASAADYKAEYKLSTVLAKPMPWGIAGERWAELINQKTNGRIKVKQYPGTSLVGGDQTKEYTAIRQGAIDMAIGSTINWSPQVKELNIFAMPFLMPDYKAIDALTQGDVGKEIFKILESKDTIPLAWGENGFRELSNSKHPIRKPEDLKGLKIRVVGSPLFLETFAALGANPTQMSWADAVPALSSGAVDGQENPLTVYTVAKLSTAANQKYLTIWGYVADPLIFVVNKEVWNSWTPRGPEGRPRGRSPGRKGEHRRGPKGSRPTERHDDQGDSGGRGQRGKSHAQGKRGIQEGHPVRLRQVGQADRARAGQEGRTGRCQAQVVFLPAPHN